MKKISILILSILILQACSTTSIKTIGQINMISNRNIDPSTEYQLISSYAGGSNKEIKKTKATSVQDAVNQTVKNVPGGEFLMNAKIMIVNDKYFAVEGDVWGFSSNLQYRGFKIGDKVFWKTFLGKKIGTIQSLKNNQGCILETEDGKIIEMNYDKLNKM